MSGLYDRGLTELRGIGAFASETAAFLDWLGGAALDGYASMT